MHPLIRTSDMVCITYPATLSPTTICAQLGVKHDFPVDLDATSGNRELPKCFVWVDSHDPESGAPFKMDPAEEAALLSWLETKPNALVKAIMGQIGSAIGNSYLSGEGAPSQPSVKSGKQNASDSTTTSSSKKKTGAAAAAESVDISDSGKPWPAKTKANEDCKRRLQLGKDNFCHFHK